MNSHELILSNTHVIDVHLSGCHEAISAQPLTETFFNNFDSVLE